MVEYHVSEEPENPTHKLAADAYMRLVEGNVNYARATESKADISDELRRKLATEGQSPFAAVVSCSDARVVPEHIFSCDLGDLFTVRAIGGEVGPMGIASLVYGCDHLNIKLVVELGHTHCGAIDAAAHHAHGDLVESETIRPLVERIVDAIGNETDARAAEVANVRANVKRIRENEEMARLMAESGVVVKGAIYDADTGLVKFLEEDER